MADLALASETDYSSRLQPPLYIFFWGMDGNPKIVVSGELTKTDQSRLKSMLTPPSVKKQILWASTPLPRQPRLNPGGPVLD